MMADDPRDRSDHAAELRRAIERVGTDDADQPEELEERVLERSCRQQQLRLP